MFPRAPALPAEGTRALIVVTSHLPDGSAIRSAQAMPPNSRRPCGDGAPSIADAVRMFLGKPWTSPVNTARLPAIS